MKAYINGIGAVSPQDTSSGDHFFEHIEPQEEAFLQIIKPNYKEYINPKILRRMSKIIRMSIVSSQIAMADAGIEVPDATITATGMGPQADTEKFLGSILENHESLLIPTAFIQSTHNTMGAQIALLAGNHNYNLTYSQKSMSFENAILDALMLIQEGDARNVLLGGIDEITEESWTIATKTGKYKASPSHNLKMIGDKKPGALAGEGATFFVLENEKKESTYASIAGIKSFFNQPDDFNISKAINNFLIENKLSVDEIELTLLGYNGDGIQDQTYLSLEENLFSKNPIGTFKNICGEYDTAVSFAVWLAARIIKEGIVPEAIYRKGPVRSEIKNILIYNQSQNTHHSLLLLKKA